VPSTFHAWQVIAWVSRDISASEILFAFLDVVEFVFLKSWVDEFGVVIGFFLWEGGVGNGFLWEGGVGSELLVVVVVGFVISDVVNAVGLLILLLLLLL